MRRWGGGEKKTVLNATSEQTAKQNFWVCARYGALWFWGSPFGLCVRCLSWFWNDLFSHP